MLILQILEDAAFAAVAAIGFSSISNPPKKAFPICALLAAVGHSLRFVLMDVFNWNIVCAGFLASLAIGFLSFILSRVAKCPAETFSFPSLLPMIPGMYAYRTIQATVLCLKAEEEAEYMHNMYLLTFNGLTCITVITVMVIGVTLPIFLLEKLSFKATKEQA